MCSRYYFDSDTMRDILDIVEETDTELRELQINRDVFPTDDAAVIIKGAGGMKLSRIKWGYPGINGSGVIINARAESVLDKKMFQGGIRRRRAVIPAGHFMSGAVTQKKIHFAEKTGTRYVWQDFMTSQMPGNALS